MLTTGDVGGKREQEEAVEPESPSMPPQRQRLQPRLAMWEGGLGHMSELNWVNLNEVQIFDLHKRTL